MWHEEAVKLDAKHKGDVLLHQGTRWLRLGVIPPSFSRDHSYAVITHERTIVSGGVDISDAELIAAAEGLGQGNPLDVINHRGEVIKSYGSLPARDVAHAAARELAKRPEAFVMSWYEGKWEDLPHEDVRWLHTATYAVITPELAIVSGRGSSGVSVVKAAKMLWWEIGSVQMEVFDQHGTLVHACERVGPFCDEQTAYKPGCTDPYDDLSRILNLALYQASEGKGAERHGNGLSFDKQPMQTLSDQLQSPDGMAFQAMKKIREARGLPTLEAKRRELLGAINYVAGMVLWYERNEGGNDE